MYRTGAVAALIVGLALASCGGGGGTPATSTSNGATGGTAGGGAAGGGTAGGGQGGGPMSGAPSRGGADGIAAGDSAGGSGGAGTSAEAGGAQAGAGARARTAAVKAATAKANAARLAGGAARGAGSCEARLGDFLARMDDLRQSLLAGLSYSEYVVRVQAVRAAYEAIPVDRLGVACLAGPATNAERAFNQYLRAANTWGECAATAGCAASEVEARLQHRWRIASNRLDAARRPG